MVNKNFCFLLLEAPFEYPSYDNSDSELEGKDINKLGN